MIEFTYPDKMKNGELERLFTAIEEALENRGFGPLVPDTIQLAIDQHGEKEIYELLGSYFASWCEVCAYDEPPSEDFYKRRAMKCMDDTEAALREMTDFRKSTARYYGRVVNRCYLCGRLRHGTKWKKDKPTPDGWIEIGTTCPDCEKQEGYHQDTYEPTEQDLQAWLSEGETPNGDTLCG